MTASPIAFAPRRLRSDLDFLRVPQPALSDPDLPKGKTGWSRPLGLIANQTLYSTGWSRPLGLIANQNAIFHGVEQAFRPDCKTKTLYSTGWSRPLGLIAHPKRYIPRGGAGL